MRLLYEALLGLRLCRIDPYKRPAVTRIRGRRRVKRVPVKLAVLLCCAARRGKRATPLRCSRAQACGARQSATSVHQCHTAHGLVGNRGGNYSLALQRRRQAARGHHRGALPTGGGALISAGGRGQACELCAWRTGCVEAAAGWPGPHVCSSFASKPIYAYIRQVQPQIWARLNAQYTSVGMK